MTLLLLRAGKLAVDLAPLAGGSIARFSVDGADILRPMTAADVASGKGNNAAAYPLVPFSNRIANGRFEFDGKPIAVPPNWPGLRHPMHGDGWSARWHVDHANDNSAMLAYVHDGRTGWPFRYRTSFDFHLTEQGLSVSMILENLEPHTVPAGMGLHPFFVREPDTELAFKAEAVWLGDAEVLPTERVAVPSNWSFARRRRPDVALDNCFDGWDRRVTVVWPSRRCRLELVATQLFGQLVVYTPPDRPFFCVEPVSHANGAIGQTRLAAGAILSGAMVFTISDL